MANSTKGKKGFQKTDNPRNIRLTYHLTKDEAERLKKHLKDNKTNHSDFIRERIKTIIKD